MPKIQLIRKKDKEVIKKYLPQLYELNIQLNDGVDNHDNMRAFCKYLICSHTHLFVMTRGKVVIGYLRVEMCKPLKRFDLTNLIVSDKFRGKGYGKTLVKHAIDFANTTIPEGANIYIDVHTTNRVAKSLYKSLGFKTFYEQMQLN